WSSDVCSSDLRRSRAHGAFRQLPQSGKHLLHRRSHSAYRERTAQDSQPGSQVAQRDQGSARCTRPHSWHEARELAAPRSGTPVSKSWSNGRTGSDHDLTRVRGLTPTLTPKKGFGLC